MLGRKGGYNSYQFLNHLGTNQPMCNKGKGIVILLFPHSVDTLFRIH